MSPPPQIIASVDVSEIQQVYLSSSRLDSDAVVAFVRALAAISQVGRTAHCGVVVGWTWVGKRTIGSFLRSRIASRQRSRPIPRVRS